MEGGGVCVCQGWGVEGGWGGGRCRSKHQVKRTQRERARKRAWPGMEEGREWGIGRGEGDSYLTRVALRAPPTSTTTALIIAAAH